MFNEAQILYLQEVLGVSPNSFASAQASSQPNIYVLTAALTPAESELLAKILGSIHLKGFVHLENPDAVPAGATHVLDFGVGLGEWKLPALAAMVGSGEEVSARKKEAWGVLQAFAKELAR